MFLTIKLCTHAKLNRPFFPYPKSFKTFSVCSFVKSLTTKQLIFLESNNLSLHSVVPSAFP